MVAKMKKRRRHPCCNNPQTKYFSSWQDDEPWCVNCGKVVRYGNGPLKHGAWKK
jgi:hypothetical protein